MRRGRGAGGRVEGKHPDPPDWYVMKRSLTGALAIGIIAAGAPSLTVGRPVAGDAAQDARTADREFSGALARADRSAAGAWLDGQFAWIDSAGRTRTGDESLAELAAFAADNAGDSGVQFHAYGDVATVVGTHHGAHFVRVWVRRPAGWRMLVHLDTPMPEQAAAQSSIEAAAGAGDCENPCRSVPYRPATAIDKAILAAWQETKMEEWHPSPHWRTHIADEFLMINSRSFRTRAERIAINDRQVASGVGSPGDPILTMRIDDFGTTSAIMTSTHAPYRGGKPYFNLRVWVFRDARWQLALSQQTTMQAAAPLPPVASRK